MRKNLGRLFIRPISLLLIELAVAILTLGGFALGYGLYLAGGAQDYGALYALGFFLSSGIYFVMVSLLILIGIGVLCKLFWLLWSDQSTRKRFVARLPILCCLLLIASGFAYVLFEKQLGWMIDIYLWGLLLVVLISSAYIFVVAQEVTIRLVLKVCGIVSLIILITYLHWGIWMKAL